MEDFKFVENLTKLEYKKINFEYIVSVYLQEKI